MVNELTSTINTAIIQQVRDVLLKNSWTQRELAQRMGITEQEASVLLSGKRPWSINYLARFKAATNTTVTV